MTVIAAQASTRHYGTLGLTDQRRAHQIGQRDTQCVEEGRVVQDVVKILRPDNNTFAKIAVEHERLS